MPPCVHLALGLWVLSAAPAPASAPASAPAPAPATTSTATTAPKSATPSDEDCDQLWEDAATAAAPDLTPTDELRKSFLLKEKAALSARCLLATRAVLECPARASKTCLAKFPQPPDGGVAFGLARCVWPEVQQCVQEDRIRTAHTDGSIERLLAKVASGELVPDKGVLKLPEEFRTLSLGGLVLVDHKDKEKTARLVLLTRNERNTFLQGVLLSNEAAFKPTPTMKVGSVDFVLGQPASGGFEVSTPTQK